MACKRQYLNNKLTLLKLLSVLALICLLGYSYLISINPTIIMSVIGATASLWIMIWVRFKYLDIMKTRTDSKLHRKNISAETDTKELIKLLGE